MNLKFTYTTDGPQFFLIQCYTLVLLSLSIMLRIDTPLTKLLGVEKPIMLAGMGGISTKVTPLSPPPHPPNAR